MFSCFVCKLNCGNKDHLHLHLKSFRHYKCNTCDGRFGSKEELRMHLRTKHPFPRPNSGHQNSSFDYSDPSFQEVLFKLVEQQRKIEEQQKKIEDLEKELKVSEDKLEEQRKKINFLERNVALQFEWETSLVSMFDEGSTIVSETLVNDIEKDCNVGIHLSLQESKLNTLDLHFKVKMELINDSFEMRRNLISFRNIVIEITMKMKELESIISLDQKSLFLRTKKKLIFWYRKMQKTIQEKIGQECFEDFRKRIMSIGLFEPSCKSPPDIFSDISKLNSVSLYTVLGIEKTATFSDIKKAFYSLSLKYHPDRGGNNEIMKKLNEAYATLTDPLSRHAYDATLYR